MGEVLEAFIIFIMMGWNSSFAFEMLLTNHARHRFDFDRKLDMLKVHKAWGSSAEETCTKGAWWTVFGGFR